MPSTSRSCTANAVVGSDSEFWGDSFGLDDEVFAIWVSSSEEEKKNSSHGASPPSPSPLSLQMSPRRQRILKNEQEKTFTFKLTVEKECKIQ